MVNVVPSTSSAKDRPDRPSSAPGNDHLRLLRLARSRTHHPRSAIPVHVLRLVPPQVPTRLARLTAYALRSLAGGSVTIFPAWAMSL